MMHILKKSTIACLSMLALLSGGSASAAPPLELVAQTPLPAVTGGDFDHFAVDLAKNRLFVPSEVYQSIEVFELSSGKHLHSVTGTVQGPHMLEYIADQNALFVADARNGYCDVLDASDFHLIKRITLRPGADFGVYDARTRLIYLGNGGKALKADNSVISVISVDTREVVGEIPVQAAVIKGMQLDVQRNRLYVNLRDKSQVAVVDLASRSVTASWTFPGLTGNAAMGFDALHRRLFVGARNPGVMFVVDPDSGKLVGTFGTVNISDDMTYDPVAQRLIVSGADGVDVFAQDNPDTYRLLQHVDTLGGKTSVYVPSLKQFYVVHTKGVQAPQAGLQVFKVN
ncbi:YncE family protein [Duganella levis]|uniref:YncE family protein n=1 Tax=Duganella levis TaxID=2692169 RepID=A0ABW9W3X2_9BURK|nr:hypothetical protein [Duganella levis]MYN28719.1 hypothetical protein [Duganella levis]